MRLAVISHSYPSEVNPIAAKFVKDQVGIIANSKEIETLLLVPTPYAIPFTSRYHRNNSILLSENHTSSRIQYLSFPKKIFPRIIRKSLSKNLEVVLEGYEPDLIHFHWAYPDGLSIPRLKKKGFKCILSIHGSDWYKSISEPVLKTLIFESLEAADLILCSGPDLKENISEFLPHLSKNIREVYNFVDETKYDIPDADQKSNACQQLNWDQSKINVIIVANLQPEKGPDFLIDCVQELNKENKGESMHFHLIGMSDNSKFAQSIIERISKLSNLNYYPAVAPDELLTYYHGADFFLSVSKREGFGLAMIEAAACGLPVVSTPVGIAPKFINDTIGFVSEDHSLTSIVDCILKLRENLVSYNSQNIRNHAIQTFGISSFKERLFSFYQEVLRR